MINEYRVIGSLNMDFVVECKEFPRSGETILGKSLIQTPGGKGGNQAMTIARLGGRTTFFGALGDDAIGKYYLNYLKDAYIDSTYVKICNGIISGSAIIEVDEKGQNRIIVIPGANDEYQAVDVLNISRVLKQESIYLLQAEIPKQSIYRAIDLIKSNRRNIIIFDAAPADRFDDAIYKDLNYITCNEGEAEYITRHRPTSNATAKLAAEWFLDRGVQNVLFKVGKRGVYYFSRERAFLCSAYENINVIDTTGAGDSFNGGFAFALGQGYSIEKAIWFGQGVASHVISSYGAQVALPDFKSAMDMYNSQEPNITNIVD